MVSTRPERKVRGLVIKSFSPTFAALNGVKAI
jgi:hypothetical protein